jgi:hypothetical protein
MSKPQGYRQSAVEAGFYVLVLCLPCYQALLFEGLGRTILVLLLACLFMFLVVRSADVCRLITACLIAFPSSWLAPVRKQELRSSRIASVAVPDAPSLTALFQRPPPIFS